VKKDAVYALLAVVFVLIAAWALASVRGDLPLTPSKPFEAAASHAKKRVDPKEKVVMHVNGEPITESEFDMFAASAPAETRQFYATAEGKRLLADELVKLKALEQEGRRIGVEDDPAVRAQLDSISSQLVAGKTLERLVNEETDKRVAAEFAKQKETARTLRHILIAYQGGQFPAKDGHPLPLPDAMQTAATLVARIRGGEDFAAIAKRESDDVQTAPRGGSIGPVSADQLPPSMQATVSKLQVGQVSDPVKTEFGVQIFKVDTPSLEEMRPMLAEKLKREVAGEAIERLHKAAKVELDKGFFPPAPVVPQPPRMQQPKTNG
jgi:parvulin-like peptidyl-prolyl isomerase